MTVDGKFFDFLIEVEGFSSCPYKDSIGIPTIGIGTTHYPDGKKVSMEDDCISKDAAKYYAQKYIGGSEDLISQFKLPINQNQFNALVSFAYNIGNTAFRKSTLLSKVIKNPNDPTIKNEFLKWNKAGGLIIGGLTNRRLKEAKLYFSK